MANPYHPTKKLLMQTPDSIAGRATEQIMQTLISSGLLKPPDKIPCPQSYLRAYNRIWTEVLTLCQDLEKFPPKELI